MSPAHARLASLASDMDNGQHNSSSSSQDFDNSNLGPDPADYNVALDIPGSEAWQVSADELVGGADNFAFGHGFDGGEDDDDEAGNNNHQDGMWQPLSGLATLPGRSKERAAPIGGKWTSAEDNALKLIVQQHGPKNWKKVSANLESSTVEMPVQTLACVNASFDVLLVFFYCSEIILCTFTIRLSVP